MTLAQILAVVIFLVMFAVIMWGRVHRYIPALVGGGLVILLVFLVVMRDPQMVLNTLNLGQLVSAKFWYPGHEAVESRGINWQTIIFIAGMMVMVEGLAKVAFFRWMCLLVARLVRYRTVPILITFMLLSGFLSMFIDSITVMLFLASVTIELARLLKFDPVPIIIAEIFASNVGGSATMSGDPPNIIIGTALGFTFLDFVENTGLIAWAGMVVSIVFFYLVFRKALSKPVSAETATQNFAAPLTDTLAERAKVFPTPREVIPDMRLFLVHTGIFIIVIILLVTHAQTGISVASIGVIAAVLTLLAALREAGHVLKRTDWRTLLFFMGLFVCVGGLEETGVLAALARYIGDISGGSLILIIPIILWISAFASAIIDNIPFAATMVPVISGLAGSMGIHVAPLAWTLALGTDIGGNATPIGASANVVGTAIAEREGYP
ncbi:MAG: SLC13 family permease, partial [Dehalococcoidales bacterium]|nr:SLC13 family permease [Dehalococcoidales bacterium]